MAGHFEVTFPCYVVAQVIETENGPGIDGYSVLQGTNNTVALMLFTDEDLANRQLEREGNPPQRGVVAVNTSKDLMKFLLQIGRTMSHVAFDPVPSLRPDAIFPMNEAIESLARAVTRQ